jgi:lauroyl/myristoyl acyltransferase
LPPPPPTTDSDAPPVGIRGLPSPIVLLYATGAALARTMPASLARAVASSLAVGAARANPTRRSIVARHMTRVYGPDLTPTELAGKVNEAFSSYARYWAESLRLPGVAPATIEAGMSWEGVGHIDEAIGAGKGAIVALPHLGGWEWAGMWMCQTGFPLTVVVEPLQPRELFEWFAGFRRALGMEVVALGPEAGTTVLQALRTNRVVCLLSDRNVGGAGVEVEFFGERTSLPAGPITLALRTGAPVLPTAIYFLPHGGHLGVIGAPLELTRQGRFRDDVVAGTQLLAGRLEELIRRAPTQWHLMQPNWPSDPGYRE